MFYFLNFRGIFAVIKHFISRLLLIVFLSVFICLFETGCSSSTQMIEQTTSVQPDTVFFIDSVEKIDELVSDTAPSLDYLQRLLDTAESLCRDSSFEEGIAHIREAIEVITSFEQLPDSAQKEMSPFYNRIVDIYSSFVPPRYFESIPDEISAMVFNRRLSQSLDSLRVSPEDSSSLAALLCHSKVNYDVPMAWNDRIYTALMFYSKGKKGPVGRWLQRAAYYLPFMQKMFVDSGLPRDLAYLPLIESGFNPKAYSYAHASGIWQFIPSTGRIYGLRQSYWLDERRDPVKSTQSAIKYLTKLYDQFNDWHLALAAYNCGEGRVERSIGRADTHDYWHLRLPRQTMNYVPKYISSLIVAKNPECFSYTMPDTTPFNLDTLHFSDCIDMKTVAEGIGCDEKEIRKINPHILRWCTPPDHSDVLLYLPPGTKEKFKEFYARIPDEKKVKWYRYRVSYGDNLIAIAQKFKVPVAAIKSVNRLRTSRIVAGKYLFIPIPVNRKSPVVAKSSTPAKSSRHNELEEAKAFRNKGLKPVKYRVRSGDTVYDLAKLFGVAPKDIMRWNQITRSRNLKAGQILTLYVVWDDTNPEPDALKKSPPSGKRQYHTVRKGDNLYQISQRLNVPLEALMEWNDLNESRPLIHAGQKLVYYSSKQRNNSSNLSPSVSSPPKRREAIRYKIKRGDNLSSLSRLFEVSVGEILALNNLSLKSILKPGEIVLVPSRKQISHNRHSTRIVYYEIKKGDNLWKIANHYGITVNRLCKLNRLTQSSILAPGDTLRVVSSENL
ncbi:MAG: LysM peptidoglycan-binding domain-containing protein [Chitinivibrionales bacterium]|nr:LysM peptidoglycan-binding domain-containing protein [Chitinivibrionales bacterium]